jgi:maltose alpha-D-glucosyltransferase / alpha-amylase
VQGFIENQGNGWTVSLAYLDRFVDEQRVRSTTDENRPSEEQPPYLRYLTQAGRRVGELHAALSSSTDLVDFAPQPTSSDDIDLWIDNIKAQAGRVFATLTERRDGFREAERALADQVLAKQADLHERLATLLPHDLDGFNMRLHGDFHLGQILIVKDDIFIVDFDGDELLPIAERRRKAPPARDIAGFLRSIDCSVRMALERALRTAPDDHGRLSAALSDWRDHAVAAFLAGYREIKANQRLWPADPHTVEAMLSFFMLEKAVAETEYELAYRPDWLRIALNNLLRVLSIPASESS